MYKLSQQISYRQTGLFSKIISDYIDEQEQLKLFFSHTPNENGIKDAIEKRKNFKTDRSLLVKVLKEEYATSNTSQEVKKNIELLSLSNTFTLCTAHQPNIFTGHLYFVYKILHTIKLAEELEAKFPGSHFVPVYYMGSEDADLEELGEVNINGKKYSHTIDPKTGLPTRGIKSATIICPNAEIADVMATPVMIMGIKAGLYMINQIKGLACIIVDDNNTIYTSKNIHLT